jgi:hypothetical protein
MSNVEEKVKTEITLDAGGEAFAAKVLPLSYHVQDSLLRQKMDYFDRLIEIDKEYGTYTMEEFDLKRSDPVFLSKIEKKGHVVAALESENIVKMARHIIDKRGLKAEHYELVMSDWDSPFWANQDIEALGDIVRSFRERIGI